MKQKQETRGLWLRFKELLLKINRWGYKKKDNYETIPQQDAIGKSMPWNPDFLREEKRRFGQGDFMWMGWVRGAWTILIAVAIFVVTYLITKRTEGLEQSQYAGIPMAVTLSITLLMYFAEWQWGERQLNRIRYNQETRKLETYPEGSYGYSAYTYLEIRDLALQFAVALVLAILVRWV